MQYSVSKKDYNKDEIAYIEVVFDNGDFFNINGNEIIEVSIKLYDRLVVENDYFCAVAESGYLKLNIKKNPINLYTESFIYDNNHYKENRKDYIENRICLEGGIKCIKFFNENNFHTTVLGNYHGEMKEDNLYINIEHKPLCESFESENHSINLNNIDKSFIRSLEFDFENCESFTVYQDEIIDMKLNFKKELNLSGQDYFRAVYDGYILLKIDDKISYRQINMFEDRKKINRKKLEQRLCGKHKSAIHDICHLYINYIYTGFGMNRRECLEIEDIKSDEEIDKLISLEDETEMEHYYFEGGNCEKLNDGTILITFGKN